MDVNQRVTIDRIVVKTQVDIILDMLKLIEERRAALLLQHGKHLIGLTQKELLGCVKARIDMLLNS